MQAVLHRHLPQYYEISSQSATPRRGGTVLLRYWSGIGPVLVRCRPDVDTVLINRTGPQMHFLTPCLALEPCNYPRIPPIDANCFALEPGRALPCSGCQLLIRVN